MSRPDHAPPAAWWWIAAAVVAVVAAAAAWPVEQAGLTQAASALRADGALISDGVSTWAGWRPLAGGLPALSVGAAHALSAALWVAAALLMLLSGRRLGLSLAGATLAAVLLAAHPLGAALHADLAGRGVLIGLLGLLGGLAAGLAPSRDLPMAAVAAVAVAVGTLGHPLAALAPLLLLLAWRALGQPVWGKALVVIGPVALVGWVVALALGAGGSFSGAPNLAAALALTGRAALVGATGTPLVREPWDLDLDAVTLTDPLAILGALTLFACLTLLPKGRLPGVRIGAGIVLVAALLLAQPLWSFASEQPPALLFTVTLGFAFAVGALMPRGRAWLVVPAVVSAAAVASAFAFTRPAQWLADEDRLELHEMAAVPDALTPRLTLAHRALSEGRHGDAITLTLGRPEQPLAQIRARALLALNRWSEVSRVIRGWQGPGKAAVECALAAARRDVTAERLCRAAIAEDPTDVFAHVDLARTLSRLGRADEAEALLRALVETHPEAASWVALVAHFETFGWLEQAVEVLDEALARHPGHRRLSAQLEAVLLRKVRGDLLAKRYDAAIAAARRLLAVDPERHIVRYYLADALAAAGDHAAAEAERARAKAAGVEVPPAVDAIPGAPRAPAPRSGPATRR